MNLRELVRRLEKIEDKAKQNKDKDTESMVGVLIEDLIEEDMKAEQEFREEVRKYIDKTMLTLVSFLQYHGKFHKDKLE